MTLFREQQQSTNRVFLETLRKRRESLAAEKALKMSRGPLGRILQRFHMQRDSQSSQRSASSTTLSKEDVRRLRLVAAARSASTPSPRPSMGRRTGHTSFSSVGGAVIAGRRLSKRGGGAGGGPVCTDNRARSARGLVPGGGGGGGRGQQQRMRSKSCVPGELEGLWQHFEPAGRRLREDEEDEEDDGAEVARARVQHVRFKRQFQRLEIGQ